MESYPLIQSTGEQLSRLLLGGLRFFTVQATATVSPRTQAALALTFRFWGERERERD